MWCLSRRGSRSVAKVVDRHGVRCCGVCGATRPIKKRAEGDQPDQCARCWGANPRSWKTCEHCGQLGSIRARTPAGRPLCARCYDRQTPTGRCEDCGQSESCASAAATAGRACAQRATGSAVRRGAATGAAGSVRSSPARRSEIHGSCAARALARLVRGGVGSAARSSRSRAKHAMERPTSARSALTDCCRWRFARSADCASRACSPRARVRSAGDAAS
jgi:hypothetical protein